MNWKSHFLRNNVIFNAVIQMLTQSVIQHLIQAEYSTFPSVCRDTRSSYPLFCTSSKFCLCVWRSTFFQMSNKLSNTICSFWILFTLGRKVFGDLFVFCRIVVYFFLFPSNSPLHRFIVSFYSFKNCGRKWLP